MKEQVISMSFYTVNKIFCNQQKVYKVLLIYEHFENTLEELKANKIKETEKFENKEIHEFLLRMIKIMANLEMIGCRHGDLRNCNVIIGKSGTLADAKIL